MDHFCSIDSFPLSYHAWQVLAANNFHINASDFSISRFDPLSGRLEGFLVEFLLAQPFSLLRTIWVGIGLNTTLGYK
jgi:hypothetical protein